jgi:hypothetical protein
MTSAHWHTLYGDFGDGVYHTSMRAVPLCQSHLSNCHIEGCAAQNLAQLAQNPGGSAPLCGREG